MARILIVDDDDLFSEMLTKVLQSYDLQVVRARGAHDALDLIDAGQAFDAFLVDIRLTPGQPNGIALARMIRVKTAGARIAHVASGSLSDAEARELRSPLLFKSFGLVRIAQEIRDLASGGTGNSPT